MSRVVTVEAWRAELLRQSAELDDERCAAFAARVARALEQDDPSWVAATAQMGPRAGADVGAGNDADAAVDVPLSSLRLFDLMLAWGCALEDDEALALFEQRCFTVVSPTLSELPDAFAQRDEIMQQLRERLLLPRADGAPRRILSYAGRGALRAWVRVAALRHALNVLSRPQRELLLDERVANELIEPQADQELRYLKESFRVVFKQAFQQAVEALEPSERSLLRYHYVDGLSVHQIGALHRVHGSTISRRISRIRQLLLARTREELTLALRVDEDELDSAMQLISGRLNLSLSRILRDDEERAP